MLVLRQPLLSMPQSLHSKQQLAGEILKGPLHAHAVCCYRTDMLNVTASSTAHWRHSELLYMLPCPHLGHCHKRWVLGSVRSAVPAWQLKGLLL